MIPHDALVFLDTTVLVHLARGKAAGRRLRDDFNLDERPERPLISIVTVGECLALAKKFKWGSKKTETLKNLLYELVVVDIHRPTVLETYAEIDAYAESNGLAGLGKNDIWIAACAASASAYLLTNDKDYLPLNDMFLRVQYVDPGTLPREA